MKIKSKNSSVKSMQLHIPYDGLVEIDANGEVEVSDKAGKLLVEGTNDWNYIGEGENTESVENAEEEAENDVKGEDTDDEVIEGIKKMSLEDMITMATEAGYPEKDWKKFAKKDKLMAAYLIKQYKASVAE